MILVHPILCLVNNTVYTVYLTRLWKCLEARWFVTPKDEKINLLMFITGDDMIVLDNKYKSWKEKNKKEEVDGE